MQFQNLTWDHAPYAVELGLGKAAQEVGCTTGNVLIRNMLMGDSRVKPGTHG